MFLLIDRLVEFSARGSIARIRERRNSVRLRASLSSIRRLRLPGFSRGLRSRRFEFRYVKPRSLPVLRVIRSSYGTVGRHAKRDQCARLRNRGWFHRGCISSRWIRLPVRVHRIPSNKKKRGRGVGGGGKKNSYAHGHIDSRGQNGKKSQREKKIKNIARYIMESFWCDIHRVIWMHPLLYERGGIVRPDLQSRAN